MASGAGFPTPVQLDVWSQLTASAFGNSTVDMRVISSPKPETVEWKRNRITVDAHGPQVVSLAQIQLPIIKTLTVPTDYAVADDSTPITVTVGACPDRKLVPPSTPNPAEQHLRDTYETC